MSTHIEKYTAGQARWALVRSIVAFFDTHDRHGPQRLYSPAIDPILDEIANAVAEAECHDNHHPHDPGQ